MKCYVKDGEAFAFQDVNFQKHQSYRCFNENKIKMVKHSSIMLGGISHKINDYKTMLSAILERSDIFPTLLVYTFKTPKGLPVQI